MAELLLDCAVLLKEKDQSIRSLNSLIGNEEEELEYRENQVEILSEEIKKLLARQV